MTTLDSAVDYHKRRWCVIPIPAGSKSPNRSGWQRERLSLDDLPMQFAGNANIGVLLGEPSAGLVDVDLDSTEAIVLAEGFLPDTDSVFGRIGKAHSHRLYVIDPAPTTTRFRDTDGTTLVELRGSGGQTVFPPSTHPSGERIEWESHGEPGRVAPDELKSSVARLAAAALLVRHWPSQGSRHDCAMALAGGLAGVGFDSEYITELVELIARAAGDDDIVDRRRAAESTVGRNGDPATGWPALAGIIGDDVAAKAREWFGTCGIVDPMPGPPAPKTRRSKSKDKRPQLQNLADVEIVPVRWLWTGRLPLGKLSLISGDPGTGKSCMTIDLAARVSAGIPWPDTPEGLNPAGGVVLLSAEDDLADTVAPRLLAAGADLTRIVALQGVEYRDKSDDEAKHFNLEQDLPVLELAFEQCPGCRLVVIDPITAYLGDTNSHVNAEVRGLLAPLSRLAGKHDVAIVCVSHLNKGAGASAVYRTMGSLAFVAAVRSAWCVLKDQDDPLRRLLLPIKVNLCREPTGMAYAVVPAPMDPSVGMVRWEPEPVTGVDLDEALAPDPGRKASVLETTTEWLEDQLANGPLAVKELKRRVDDAGYSWRSCQRAQQTLGIKPQKQGYGAGWAWSLPASKEAKLSPVGALRHSKVAKPSPPPVGALRSSKIAKHPPPVGALRVAAPRVEGRQRGEYEGLAIFEPDVSSDVDEREANQAVESDEAMWAELATMPLNVLKDRASRTDDPETKRRLLALARRKPAPIQTDVNNEDGDAIPF